MNNKKHRTKIVWSDVFVYILIFCSVITFMLYFLNSSNIIIQHILVAGSLIVFMSSIVACILKYKEVGLL